MAAYTVGNSWLVVIPIPAEIDTTNARDVRCQLTAAALKPGVRIVIADMTATTFCDSEGLRAFLVAHQRAARNGTELRLLRLLRGRSGGDKPRCGSPSFTRVER